MRTTIYQKAILELDPGLNEAEARRIEGAMRLQYSTLNHLSDADFRREIRLMRDGVRANPETWDRNAESFGL